MVKNFSDGHPVLPVFDKEFGYEIFAMIGDIRPDWMTKGDLLVDSLTSDFFVILAIERKVSSKH